MNDTIIRRKKQQHDWYWAHREAQLEKNKKYYKEFTKCNNCGVVQRQIYEKADISTVIQILKLLSDGVKPYRIAAMLKIGKSRMTNICLNWRRRSDIDEILRQCAELGIKFEADPPADQTIN
jgi:hypothetical protein